MPRTYQDIYPSDPFLRSTDVVRPRASDLIHLEFFEAEAAEMPRERFVQHHILVNLLDEMQRVENWREGEHREFTLRRDDIVITPAGVESGWRWHVRSKVIIITIVPAELKRFAERELGVLLTDRQVCDVPQTNDPDLTSAAELLLTALQTRSSGSEVMYESLARIFAVKLLERYGEDAAAEAGFSKAFTPQHYKRVLDFVADHFGEAIAIADLARAAGLSEAHFSRQFRKTIGDSPHQFLMRYRVERATTLLGDTARPLGEIAFACGFSDQAHLTRLFKRFTGETPRQYRART
ncbi:MAG: AraC family transcriptional regulator [Erythrobacter sp.]|nr:AraC family transcriptional regulator [Erythrobacter sp.]